MTQNDGRSGCLTFNTFYFFLGTLYDGEKFQLEFKFGSKYPFESPEVRNLMFYFSALLCF